MGVKYFPGAFHLLLSAGSPVSCSFVQPVYRSGMREPEIAELMERNQSPEQPDYHESDKCSRNRSSPNIGPSAPNWPTFGLNSGLWASSCPALDTGNGKPASLFSFTVAEL